MPSLSLHQDDDELLPQSCPLKSISQLRIWQPNQKTKFNVSNICLQLRPEDTLRPRLILIHDTEYCYTNDRFIQGSNIQNMYHFKQWHLVDTFIYFSKERLSIPPVNWINVCHRNGVKCLGTLLIKGASQVHELEMFLQGPPNVSQNILDIMNFSHPYFADKLVEIAKYYGFDGWLIRIATEFFPFPAGPKVKSKELAKFLKNFTEKIHFEIPGSEIIWFDNMTNEGQGIVIAHLANTSSALYGVSWIYNQFGRSNFEKIDDLFWRGGTFSEFPTGFYREMVSARRQSSDDSSDDEIAYEHKKGISDVISPHTVTNSTWFVTNFCKGFGDLFFYKGKKLHSEPWFHLSHQSVLPNLDYQHPIVDHKDDCIEFTAALENDDMAFTGGTSLNIYAQHLAYKESLDGDAKITLPLYKTSIDVNQGCTIKLVYRSPTQNEVKLNLCCYLSLIAPDISSLSEVFNNQQHEKLKDQNGKLQATIEIKEHATECATFSLSMVDEEQHCAWITKTAHVPPLVYSGKLVLEKISLLAVFNTATTFGFEKCIVTSIGYLSVLPLMYSEGKVKHELVELHLKDYERIVNSDVDDVYYLFATLSWKSVTDNCRESKMIDYVIVSYKLPHSNEKFFLGTSFCDQYRISGLSITKTKSPVFIIESVNREGDISAQASLQLPYVL
ncbi:hypothetical protein G6F43_004816 [Rhizopus delemar]|nr:hypothetical protein G6F43_004816 [Rhizopus delemar]